MNYNLKKLEEIIAKNKSFAIISHLNPDGDNLGSLLAFYYYLKGLDKEVKAIQLDKIPSKFNFILEDEEFITNGDFTVDVLIALDCGDKKRLGDIDNLYNNAKEVVKIDHHLSDENYGSLNIVDSTISSTCELLASIFIEMNIEFNEKIATFLLMGILTDTGRYLYERVSSETFLITSKLLQHNARKDFLMKNLFQSNDLNSLKLINKINNEAKFYYNNALVISTVTTNMINSFEVEMSDVDYAINYYRDAKDVEVSCMIKEKEANLYKISFRSKNYIDVNKVAKSFNGGGHKFAAGCVIEGSAAEVEQRIIERFKDIEWK